MPSLPRFGCSLMGRSLGQQRSTWCLSFVLLTMPPTAAFALIPSGTAAQGIVGRIVDAETQEGVPEARVLVQGASEAVASSTTDENGYFEVLLGRPGRYALQVEALGYSSATSLDILVHGNETIWVEVDVAPVAIELPPIRVVRQGRASPALVAAGFYRRQSRGIGTFMTRDDIDQQRPRDTADLFRRVPGFRVVQTRWGEDPVSTRPTGFGGTCYPALFLDGARMGRRYGTINDLIPPEGIEAIEAYAGPSQTPPQWKTMDSCGAIVIWTR